MGLLVEFGKGSVRRVPGGQRWKQARNSVVEVVDDPDEFGEVRVSADASSRRKAVDEGERQVPVQDRPIDCPSQTMVKHQKASEHGLDVGVQGLRRVGSSDWEKTGLLHEVRQALGGDGPRVRVVREMRWSRHLSRASVKGHAPMTP